MSFYRGEIGCSELSHVRDCIRVTLNVGDLVGGVSLDCSQIVCVVGLDAGEFVCWRIVYCRARTIMRLLVV